MGNATSSTLENSINKLSLEHLEAFFNAVSTGRDPSDPTSPLMTKNDFTKQFPSLSQQRLFGQSYFQLFDQEGLDSVDFSSFFGTLTVLVNQKLDTKFDALFRLLDPAGNGVLQEYELLGFVEKTFQSLHGIDPTVDWANPVTIEMTNEEIEAKMLNGDSTNKTGRTSLQSSSSSSLLPDDITQQYRTVPITFGPLELCFDSHIIVEKGLTAIGKATPLAPAPIISTPSLNNTLSTTAPGSSRNMNRVEVVTPVPAPITRTVNKTEFGNFIRASPQLLLTILWAMNISSIQYVCQQTRLQFIQHCEAQLASQFPLSESHLIEQYFKIATFYHEVLLRRLALNNNVKEGSLLQQDLITLQQHFTTAPNVLGASNSVTTAPDSTTSNPSTPRRTSRFSFSRHRDDPDQSLPGVVEDSTTTPTTTSSLTSAPSCLFPKVTQFNYPLTYSLTDSAVQLAPIGSQPPIKISTVINAGTAQSNLAALPTLASSPSLHKSGHNNGNNTGLSAIATSANNNNNSTSDNNNNTNNSSNNRSRSRSMTRDASMSNIATFNTLGPDGDATAHDTTVPVAPFVIPTSDFYSSTPSLSTMSSTLSFNSSYLSTSNQTATDFARQSYPDTLPFTLLFFTQLKLQSLLHRNRLVSKAMCEDLIHDMEENLNDSYVKLITQQYVYEMQHQYTQTNAGNKTSSQECDINNNLIQILDSRKKNSASTSNTNNPTSTPTLSSPSPSTTTPTMGGPVGDKKERRFTTSASSLGKQTRRAPQKGSNIDPSRDRSRSGSRLSRNVSQNRTSINRSQVKDDKLGLDGLELSTDSDSDDDDDDDDGDIEDDIEDPEITFGSAKTPSKKTKLSSKNLDVDGDEDENNDSSDSVEFANDHLINLHPSKKQQSSISSTTQPHYVSTETTLPNPGYAHLMTEAIIPHFLQKATKAINVSYTPHARGPYAMPYLTLFLRQYLPDALGQLLAAYRHVLSKKVKDQLNSETAILLVDVKDYLDELLKYKQNVQDQFQVQQGTIHELEDTISLYKNQHEDLASELLLTKEQNAILKTELTDVISVKDMAIITLRDELQFFTKESQHWSDQISKLNQQVVQLKQERIQRDVEVAQLRAQKDAGGCCSIM